MTETATVRAFWEREACGERYGDEQELVRYRLEPEIVHFADFPASAGKRLLEVGVGMGADLVRFARAGAVITGVDLTERAVALTKGRLAKEGLSGDVRMANAEALPFADGSFDIVYSWGVLHHTPGTARAVRECIRVLAPGGRLAVMVYHRHSWLALAAWTRHCALRGRLLAPLSAGVERVESPGTKAFAPTEMRAMLHGLNDVRVRPVLTHWDRRVAPGAARLGGDRFGWFLLAEGTMSGRR